MALITTKFRGRCVVCGEVVEAGDKAYFDSGKTYFDSGKITCQGCGEFIAAAKGVPPAGPVAAALQFRGTSMEVVRQLRVAAQRLAASLKTATRDAEALSLGLQQVEDQQKTGQPK